MAYDPLNNVEDLAIAGECLADDFDITHKDGFETVLEVRRNLRSWLVFAVLMLLAVAPFALNRPASLVAPPLADCLMGPYRSATAEQEPQLCLATDRIPTADEVHAFYRNRRVAAAAPGAWEPGTTGKIRLALSYWEADTAALPLNAGHWPGFGSAAQVVAHQAAFPTGWQVGTEATEAQMDAKVEAHAQYLVAHLDVAELSPAVYQWAREDLGLLSEEQAALIATDVGRLHAEVNAYNRAVTPERARAVSREVFRTRLGWLRLGSVLTWMMGFIWLCRARVVTVRREGAMLYIDGAALYLDTGVAAHADGDVVRLISDRRVVWELRPELWGDERCAALAYLINRPAKQVG